MAKKKKKAKQKVEKKVKKVAVKVDRCNRREGTQGWLINEHISNMPKTVEQLCKETGLPKRRIVQHAYHMTKLGHYKKTTKGYCWK